MRKEKRLKADIARLRTTIRTAIENRFYNLFLDSVEWDGLTAEQVEYAMRQLWNTGTISAFRIPMADEIALAQYAVEAWNIYDFPEVVRIINKRGVPYFPANPQVVGVDVVLGWALANHKPIRQTLLPYINRMVEVEMVIHTNLQTHKSPIIIGVSEADRMKAEDVMSQIYNDEYNIYTDFSEINNVKVLSTGSQYIIDKLKAYEVSIENEALTLIGIDNTPVSSNSAELLIDQVNANNAQINLNREGIIYHLTEFADDITEILGYDVSVRARQTPVQSVYEDTGMEVSGGDNGGTENNGKEKEEDV